MSWKVEGRVGVIAGATSALGTEVARRLAVQHGMRLALLSRKPFAHPLPSGCVAFQADVAKHEDCDAVMQQIRESMGAPTSLLINCAGVTLSKLHLRCTHDDFRHMMDTNVGGALHLTKAGLRYGGLLQAEGGAAVVHVGSVVGCVGNPGQVLYGASKAALSGAVKSWCKEYGAKQIRFNVVAPGLMEGRGMGESLSEAQREQWRQACPMKRLGMVEEVADVVVMAALCSYLNGQTIAVDGGIS